MSFFTESQVRQKASEAKSYKTVSTEELLIESNEKFESSDTNYDIFLSHSFKDAELILGIKKILEDDYGYSVYVDWIEDKHLERDQVTKYTAQVLKDRMNNAKSLIFVTTENSETSKWMPWELGYFDGVNGHVAILPIMKYDTKTEYEGQEYLELYPYISYSKITGLKLNENKKNTSAGRLFRDMLLSVEVAKFEDWIN
ncbi:toll/interleukin-1 receptor domain-containing protein [Aliarcobacter butzleri]|uniref:toll/interleukin-1 receptor domain-containing protein n=1 Tax=Aliarcobacter butzleri TaxID=28197 RepID=UPI0021B2FA5B|nr:toll/interleukin-1 receptor domain-containing protein [Aliarcobacter butzleri]MCT7586740.1 toll/interleukin-1 receptor domain-containing protein [Aliarcobacter butzleri]